MNRIWLVMVALCLALPASAQMYKWKDANGKWQYSDTPPPPCRQSSGAHCASAAHRALMSAPAPCAPTRRPLRSPHHDAANDGLRPG